MNARFVLECCKLEHNLVGSFGRMMLRVGLRAPHHEARHGIETMKQSKLERDKSRRAHVVKHKFKLAHGDAHGF